MGRSGKASAASSRVMVRTTRKSQRASHSEFSRDEDYVPEEGDSQPELPPLCSNFKRTRSSDPAAHQSKRETSVVSDTPHFLQPTSGNFVTVVTEESSLSDSSLTHQNYLMNGSSRGRRMNTGKPMARKKRRGIKHTLQPAKSRHFVQCNLALELEPAGTLPSDTNPTTAIAQKRVRIATNFYQPTARKPTIEKRAALGAALSTSSELSLSVPPRPKRERVATTFYRPTGESTLLGDDEDMDSSSSVDDETETDHDNSHSSLDVTLCPERQQLKSSSSLTNGEKRTIISVVVAGKVYDPPNQLKRKGGLVATLSAAAKLDGRTKAARLQKAAMLLEKSKVAKAALLKLDGRTKAARLLKATLLLKKSTRASVATLTTKPRRGRPPLHLPAMKDCEYVGLGHTGKAAALSKRSFHQTSPSTVLKTRGMAAASRAIIPIHANALSHELLVEQYNALVNQGLCDSVAFGRSFEAIHSAIDRKVEVMSSKRKVEGEDPEIVADRREFKRSLRTFAVFEDQEKLALVHERQDYEEGIESFKPVGRGGSGGGDGGSNITGLKTELAGLCDRPVVLSKTIRLSNRHHVCSDGPHCALCGQSAKHKAESAALSSYCALTPFIRPFDINATEGNQMADTSKQRAGKDAGRSVVTRQVKLQDTAKATIMALSEMKHSMNFVAEYNSTAGMFIME